MLFGEFDQARAAGEVPFAPRCDHLDVGRERVIAEFEADLIVTLAGRAVADRVGIDHPRDFNLALGDQRPRDRGAEQVKPFIQGVGAHHREDVIAHEFLAQVVDEDVLRLDAGHLRLLAGGLQLLALPEVGGEGHHLALIGLLQPFQDHARIQPARIGENDTVDLIGHGSILGLRWMAGP